LHHARIAIENSHDLVQVNTLNPMRNPVNLQLPVVDGHQTGDAEHPPTGSKREQSVASRLERHPTPSAKTDGKCKLPAVNPGGFCSPGFLVFGRA
jgi:hypothetical protein